MDDLSTVFIEAFKKHTLDGEALEFSHIRNDIDFIADWSKNDGDIIKLTPLQAFVYGLSLCGTILEKMDSERSRYT